MVQPVNITSAAIITQFSLGAMMSLGALILFIGRGSTPWYERMPDFSVLAWIISFFILLTLGCLVFSDEFSKLYQPLFGTASLTLLPWSIAILLVYTINIVSVALLVSFSGGSRVSPFSPLYIMLPTLAIFLREPLGRILYYLVLTLILFSFTFCFNIYKTGNSYEPRNVGVSYWTVSTVSLILTVFIGFITRPT